MRITGGMARGVVLQSPKGSLTRPATDQVRAAVFSSLMHSGILENAIVLDLFAGTGAYGLEALSRAAASICFIEKSEAALVALKHNAANVSKSIGISTESIQVLDKDVMSCHFSKNAFHLIFVDPPYELWNNPVWVSFFCKQVKSWSKVSSWIVAEMPGELATRDFSGLKSIRRFGKVGVKGGPMVVIFQLVDVF